MNNYERQDSIDELVASKTPRELAAMVLDAGKREREVKADAIREWADQVHAINSMQRSIVDDAYRYANKLSRVESGLTFKFMPYDGVDCSVMSKNQIQCVIDRMRELGAHVYKTADDFSESKPVLIWYSRGTCFDYKGSYKNKRLIAIDFYDWPQDALEQNND